MKNLNWFEIEVYYPIDASLFDNEELSEVDRLTAGIVEGYEIGTAYFNLGQSTIQSLLPKCFIPKGKTNKKFYTEITFVDGSFAMATLKPFEVYAKIDEYLSNLPVSSN
jgi:hypothetical protein